MLALVGVALAGCATDRGTPGPEDTGAATEAAPDEPDADAAPADPEPTPDPGADVVGAPEDDATPSAAPRPDWLGTRELPLRPDGLGEVMDTPPELRDRRLPPPEHLPRPGSDVFDARITTVPDDVAARSTWHPACPVDLDDLRYVTLTFWGFDDRAHTGELLVHERAAQDLVGVFRTLYEQRFPIEEMRVVAADELDAPPTGDGNNTTAFVCRNTVEGSNWSQHAYGLAVDINPFHNPYARGEVVIPELASVYLDRDDHRPGMIRPGDAVTDAFGDIGWGWGGDWHTASDWMHFSESGR